MSEFMWPPENINISIYENISEEPISIQDFASQLPTKHVIPALAFLIYRKQKFSYREWVDLILGLKKIDKQEQIAMESNYIATHKEELADEALDLS